MQRPLLSLLTAPLIYLLVTGLFISVRATSSAPDIDWLQQYGYSYSDPDNFRSAYHVQENNNEKLLNVSLYALAE